MPNQNEDGRTAPARQVLIIEHHPDGRGTLRHVLSLLGYVVEVAVDGFEGIAKGLALRPAAALVDIGLPGLDGFEVARQLRAGLGRHIRLIAHTAYPPPDEDEPSSRTWFDAWLQKPLKLADLLGLLDTSDEAASE